MAAPNRLFFNHGFDRCGPGGLFGPPFFGHPCGGFVIGTWRADDVSVAFPVTLALLGGGNDSFTSSERVGFLHAGFGDDTLHLSGPFGFVHAGPGDDVVTVRDEGGSVDLGGGNDVLELLSLVSAVNGGAGTDMLVLDRETGSFDFGFEDDTMILIDRFSRETIKVENVEQVSGRDEVFSIEEIFDRFSDADDPAIHVGSGTQVVTVNDADPTVSVLWDRSAQQAVIETGTPVGPTIASRAYAMVHTAIYDAWSAYDDTAVRVSFDIEGDNAALSETLVSNEANKAKAMSYAAFTVLNDLFPDQTALFETVMTALGFSPADDGSAEAAVGIDAAEDLLALRAFDGSNQAGGYRGAFTPTNPSPLEINDIAAWTPESVPIDPEDDDPEQSFLTPHWLEVESFALPELADGTTDFSQTLPPAPQPFFMEGFEDSKLNFAEKTITLGKAVSIGGTDCEAGDVIEVDRALIGVVINAGFIDQAQNIVDVSAALTDEQKIIAEFWEDGGGTAFPPGTFMTFAQYVSARDDNTLDEDVALFFAMSNALFDAGIATWQAKVEYDYVRPVRAVRDLGELGLIGEYGVDELTGETGFVIEAFAGFDPETGEGLGTQTILAENFVPFQRPGADPSPPFSEYTSGHSAYSAAGAEVLRLATGSDAFGASVDFAPGSTQFEAGVPKEPTRLFWETFSEASDEAGISRLFGGIHFAEGDLYGRQLGRDVGAAAFEAAQLFLDGEATDADRPFFDEVLFV